MAFKVTKKSPARAAQRTGADVFVGSTAKTFPAGVLVCRRFADLPTSVRETPKNRVFVSYRRSSTDNLLQEGLKLGRGAHMGKLLTLEPPRPESIPSLSGIFERVIGAIPGYKWLPLEELPTALSGKDAADHCIGGAADAKSKTLALVRGNLATLVVPFAYLKASGEGTRPDFSRLSLADYGLTIALGEYEASADGMLHVSVETVSKNGARCSLNGATSRVAKETDCMFSIRAISSSTTLGVLKRIDQG